MEATGSEAAPARVDGRTLRHQHRRPEIVAALTEFVLENGLADLSLRQAASAVGVSHVTLLRHFATKDDLVLEVVEQIRTGLAARAESEIHSDVLPDLGAFLWAQWAWLTEPRECRQFILLFEIAARQWRGAHSSADLGRSVTDDLVITFQEKLTRAFGLPEEEAATIAVLAIAQIRGLVIDLVVSGSRRRADAAMRQFIELLGQRAGPALP